MKKAFRWIAVLLLSPLLLFLILTALLYVPPIQNWVAQRVADYASQQTGLQISVEHVDISFPLDIGIDGVLVRNPPSEDEHPQTSDTLFWVRRAVADVKLWPLFSNHVEIDGLELQHLQLNTGNMIDDMRLAGTIGTLKLDKGGDSPTIGIDLKAMTVDLRQPLMADADLCVYMSDTAAIDTSTAGWHIRFDRFQLERSHVSIDIDSAAIFDTTAVPPPTHIAMTFGDARLCDADLHLGLGRYDLGRVDWQQGMLAYDSLFCLTAIDLGLDSFYYDGTDLRMTIDHASTTEQLTGLELTRMKGSLAMTGDDIRIENLDAATPHSQFAADGAIDLAQLAAHLSFDASIGKSDLMALTDGLPATLWPDEPLTLQGRINGDADRLDIEDLYIDLPTLLHAEATGKADHIDDPDHLKAQLRLKATGGNLDPLFRHFGLPADYRVPSGISLAGSIEADGPHCRADLTAREGEGTITLKASATIPQLLAYSSNSQNSKSSNSLAYQLHATVENLDVRHFMPRDSVGHVNAVLQLSGRGQNPTSVGSTMEGSVRLQHLQYGRLSIDSIDAVATLNAGDATVTLSSNSPLLKGTADIVAHLSQRNTRPITATVDAQIASADLLALGLDSNPIVVGLDCSVELESDLLLTHRLSAFANHIYIRDTVKTHHPEDFGLLLKTSPDTVVVRAQSGDLIVKFDASGSYEQLADDLSALADTIAAQVVTHTIDQGLLKRMLPTARLYATCQRGNPMAAILQSTLDTEFKDLHVDLTSSPAAGLNGEARLYSLRSSSYRFDTLRVSLVDKGTHLSFNGQLTNNRRNPMAVFNILFDGLLQQHGASIGVRYFDEQGHKNVRIGTKMEMADEGLRFQLIPSRPTLGYKEFTLNDDNYLLLHPDMRIETNIDLKADDGTRLQVYSVGDEKPVSSGEPASSGEAGQPSLLQDITISVHQLDLGALTHGLAMLPNIDGVLEGDYHLMRDADGHLQVASDMSVTGMAYEGSHIGNLGSEFVYMLREDDSHAVDAQLLLEGEPIGTLQGSYWVGGRLDGTLQLDHMPLSIINGFMPDQLLGFEGTADGTVAIKGTTDRLQADGEVRFTDGYLVSLPYGMRMRFGDQPLQIKDSKLLFDEFTLYAYNENPLMITGNIDFHDTSHSAIDLRMRARDFQLINAKQTRESVAYGKMFVNFFTRLTGSIDQLHMRGRLEVLGTTDLSYILLDSPLSTDNRLDELVRFTDFSDTTQTVVKRPESDALDIDVQLNIDQGSHVRCALNAEQTNYVDLFGGGDLRMRMGGDGMNLTGRYTISSGTMKYSLPIIPLKTFTIKEDSYVEFTGDPANPRLNLTATERTRAAVGGEDGQSRSVTFDCGVVITQTLENMGLQFTISAPEDMQVQSELSTMGAEQRGKLAVTMLTTGMYLADGNTNAFSMNSALSSFLQNEINNITAGTLKNVDLQLGVDNTTDGSGQMHTDYSFKFSKRFWNNRLNVQIGGKVSTGSEVQGQQQSFFDNVTMEYRLSPTSNQYVKLFFKQNVYDWLEGYTGEYGGGYLWKRKLNSLFDLFKKEAPLRPTQRPTQGLNQGAEPTQKPTQALPKEGVLNYTIQTDSLQSNETQQ